LDILLKDDETVILLLGVSFEGIWEREVEEKRAREREILMHCKKKDSGFPVPSRDVIKLFGK
jgi:hypothetical protein